jgi:hypothetical protein
MEMSRALRARLISERPSDAKPGSNPSPKPGSRKNGPDA